MRVLWRKVGIKPGDLPKDGFKKAEMMGMYNPPIVAVRAVRPDTYPERLQDYKRKQRALKRAEKGVARGPK